MRREILSVSERLFARTGFRGTSLQMVADQVGCSKATLLYHFSSKGAILETLLTDLDADLARVIESVSELPEEERIRRLVSSAIGLIVTHRWALAIIRGLGETSELSPAIVSAQQRADYLRELLHGPEPSTTDLVAMHVFGDGVLGACLQLQDATDDELGEALRTVAFRLFGLDGPRPRPAS